MKSAFLLSFDDALIPKARQAVREAGPGGWEGCEVVYLGDDCVQVQEIGTERLFTLDTYDPRPEYAWAYQNPPHHLEPGVAMPDLSAILAYSVLCRWEDLFVRLVRAVTDLSGQPAWVLDENDVVWDARAVDPDRVLL